MLLFQPQGIGDPSVYHAVVVIFLEFFAWGLLTTPMLTVNQFYIPTLFHINTSKQMMESLGRECTRSSGRLLSQLLLCP